MLKLKTKPEYHVDNKTGVSIKFDRARDIKLVPIDSVIPWKENPRKNEQASEKLSKLLSEHGQVTPIVVWKKNNVIYKGNTTWKALKILGKKEVMVMFVDFPSEQAAVAYAISDNRASEYAYWDDELLSLLMDGQGLKYDNLGFTKKEFESIMLIPDLEKLKSATDQETDEIYTHRVVIACKSAESAKEVREAVQETFGEEVRVK